jgi:plasmid stability protein
MMKQIIIRNLDDSVMHRLKKIAWMEGESPEETARRLFIEAVQSRTQHDEKSRLAEPAA